MRSSGELESWGMGELENWRIGELENGVKTLQVDTYYQIPNTYYQL